MRVTAAVTTRHEFIERVRAGVMKRVGSLDLFGRAQPLPGNLVPGKMLRTRLAARLAVEGETGADLAALEDACAATEMLHTATLCHDDVVDNALLRRAAPTLWRSTGTSAAVMIGDWLLCEAIQMIADCDSARYLAPFLDKVRETCLAEAEHEIALRGRQLDLATCLRLARGKTGPLFSFVGLVCGGPDGALAAALEESGYRVGTAYQLADDLLDVAGQEAQAGKTLGGDAARRKFTLSQSAPDGPELTLHQIVRQLRDARDLLAPWPACDAALRRYLAEDFLPALRCLDRPWRTRLESALNSLAQPVTQTAAPKG